MSKMRCAALLVAASVSILAGPALAQDATQKQIDQIKSVLPKFAIPMREVGDRFQNMYWAAKGGNWALAAYMSKYMNGALNPASLTKPAEYATWKNFYDNTFSPVTKAINAKDFKAFEGAYKNAVTACNGCHAGMGYGFIEIRALSAPVDPGMNYKKASQPGDVPP